MKGMEGYGGSEDQAIEAPSREALIRKDVQDEIDATVAEANEVERDIDKIASARSSPDSQTISEHWKGIQPKGFEEQKDRLAAEVQAMRLDAADLQKNFEEIVRARVDGAYIPRSQREEKS